MKRLCMVIAFVILNNISNAQHIDKKPPQPVTANKYAPYSIRIAEINGPWDHIVDSMPSYYIPEHFLERAKRNGYNYICAQFVFHTNEDWDKCGNLIGDTLKNKLKRVFKQVDAHGMQFIPLYSLGSVHASNYWKRADSTIQHNVYIYNDTIHQCPVFAPHEPLDDAFEILIDVIAQAYQEAVPGKNLDFIHIGHDEPIAFAPESTLLIGQDTLDRNYISTYGHNIQDGIEKLLANEIKRRVAAIRNICARTPYGFETKTIIFGDMWDPEHYGGVRYPVRWEGVVYDSITTCGVIDEEDALTCTDDLVLVSWIYEPDLYDDDYDTYHTLSTFNEHGFDYIFAHAIAPRYVHDSIPPTEFPTPRIKQLGEWINTYQLPGFRGHALGCAAVPWCWYSDTVSHLAFYSLDYIAQQTWYYSSIMD